MESSDVAEAWGAAVHILDVPHQDVEISSVIRSGVLQQDFLKLINSRLRTCGTEKSLEFLTAVLPAYPTIALYSTAKSQSVVDNYIARNKDSYERTSVPFEFVISADDPVVIDLQNGLNQLVELGVEVSGINVTYADKGNTLQLIIYFDVSKYKPLAVEQAVSEDKPLTVASGRVTVDETKLTPGAAQLRLDAKELQVTLPGIGDVVFCSYRPDMPPYFLMSHLFELQDNNPLAVFSETDMHNLAGCQQYDTLSNALRSCGFDAATKLIFFTTKGRTIIFKPIVDITKEQGLSILVRARKNGSKRKSTEVSS